MLIGVDSAGDLEGSLSKRLHKCCGEGHGGHLQGHLPVFHHLQWVLLELDGVNLGRAAHTNQMPGHIIEALAHCQTYKSNSIYDMCPPWIYEVNIPSSKKGEVTQVILPSQYWLSLPLPVHRFLWCFFILISHSDSYHLNIDYRRWCILANIWATLPETTINSIDWRIMTTAYWILKFSW